jgi:hypothetical protein
MQRPSIGVFLSVLSAVAIFNFVVGAMNFFVGNGFELFVPYRRIIGVATPVPLAVAQSIIAAAASAFVLRSDNSRWWLVGPLSALNWFIVVGPVTHAALEQYSVLLAALLALTWSAIAFPFTLRYMLKRLNSRSPPNKSLERTRER